MKTGKLDFILRELEHAGKVNLTEARGKLVVGLRRSG